MGLNFAWWLALLFLTGLPAMVQAQFTFTTNSGAITITSYTGSGGVVTIPDTINGLPVTCIGSKAFELATSVTNIAISTNITSIQDGAFLYSSSLTEVTIPGSVTNLGMEVFYGCSRLVAINVDVLNPVYSSASGIMFNNDQTTLVQYPPGLKGSYLVPDNVTRIKDRAFEGCGGLTSIAFNTNIVSIGDAAFNQCILTNVFIPSSVTSLSMDVFASCHSLTNISLPNTLTNIGMSAFFDCNSLNDVVIPASVSTIGQLAFYSCDSLTSLTVPNNVTSIGPQAFASCIRLATISVGSLNPHYTSASGVLFDKTLTLLLQCPGGKSGNYAIPGSVNNIGDYAFNSCVNLTGVTIPTSVTNVGAYAFANSSLRSVTIPGMITSWGSSAFQSCPSLTNAVILDGVTSIGDAAFSLCSSLSNVAMPNTVTNLGSSAFANCSRLAQMILSDNLTGIGAGAFNNCVKLTSVTIPASVAVITNNAFQNCTGLLGIYFKGNPPALGSNDFNGDTKATVFYLGGATGWGSTFGGLPAVLWNVQAQTTGNNFGVLTNKFGFTITGTTNLVMVVEACTNLSHPSWQPVRTNTLTTGSVYFSDPEWSKYPGRFYRLRSP